MTDPTVRKLLQRARDSLDDAGLLAEHRRSNEIVLTRLALHQALQAISVAEGLDGSDALQMQTLLRRVPADHPQAALVALLGSEEMPTIASVAELVEALGRPAPKPARRPVPAAAATTPGGPEPDAGAEDPSPASGRSGLTALSLSPDSHGRARPASSVPSAAFWTLMDRWRIGDADALALIGHPGGLTRKGTRPRFRLQGEEAVRFGALRALDLALETLGLAPADWLATGRPDAPLQGDTPLALLTRDGAQGARQLIRMLNRQGLKTALGG